MYPIVCRFGRVAINSYGLMIGLGLVICLYLIARRAPRFDLKAQELQDMCLITAFVGIIGARLLYCTQYLEYYLRRPLEILYVWKGGLVLYGGVILGIGAAIAFAKLRKLPVMRSLDFLAVHTLFVQGAGRIGCFLKGCCRGIVVPPGLGVRFPNALHAMFPTQLLEAALLFASYVWLWRTYSKGLYQHPGRTTGVYFFIYGCIRLITQRFRQETYLAPYGLGVVDLISLGCVAIGVLLLWVTNPGRQKRLS